MFVPLWSKSGCQRDIVLVPSHSWWSFHNFFCKQLDFLPLEISHPHSGCLLLPVLDFLKKINFSNYECMVWTRFGDTALNRPHRLHHSKVTSGFNWKNWLHAARFPALWPVATNKMRNVGWERRYIALLNLESAKALQMVEAGKLRDRIPRLQYSIHLCACAG